MQSDDYNRKQPGLRQGLTYIAQEVWDGWGAIRFQTYLDFESRNIVILYGKFISTKLQNLTLSAKNRALFLPCLEQVDVIISF